MWFKFIIEQQRGMQVHDENEAPQVKVPPVHSDMKL